MSAMELARAERLEFASLLDGLSAQQWKAPTLCDEWRVRQLVTHVLSYEELSRAGFYLRIARSVLTFRNANLARVQELPDRPPEQLAEMMREWATPRGLTTGFGGLIALADGMIHQQDIRRPLGIARVIPPQRLRVVLDFVRWAPPLRGALRVRGARLVATDLDWTHGSGARVEGSGEALLMAMAGRSDALKDLAGPGKDILVQRLSR
jgi:uncharacterized protein (TIGR03083 family)